MNTEHASPSHPRTAKRFLALGDSYTIGEAVLETERWPNQLRSQLQSEGVELHLPEVIAQTGWTTDDLIAGINASRIEGPFDLVTLLIGVNNQYQGLDEGDYVREFDVLLDLAIHFGGGSPGRVVVLSIPDWGATPFAADRDNKVIGSEIDRFNLCKHERVRSRGCRFVDVTPLSRLATEDSSLLAQDGLHPSAKMYATWCELALPTVRLALSS